MGPAARRNTCDSLNEHHTFPIVRNALQSKNSRLVLDDRGDPIAQTWTIVFKPPNRGFWTIVGIQSPKLGRLYSNPQIGGVVKPQCRQAPTHVATTSLVCLRAGAADVPACSHRACSTPLIAGLRTSVSGPRSLLRVT